MDKFIVNIIHRPEMVPEYSATVTGQGKEEDIGDKALLTESLDIFKTQQRLAHENGLKVTIQMTYCLTMKRLRSQNMIMKSMETKSHFPFWDCLAKSSVRNIRQKISVSGCFPWKTRRQSLMMCSRNSMIVSAFTRSQPVPTIWTQS